MQIPVATLAKLWGVPESGVTVASETTVSGPRMLNTFLHLVQNGQQQHGLLHLDEEMRVRVVISSRQAAAMFTPEPLSGRSWYQVLRDSLKVFNAGTNIDDERGAEDRALMVRAPRLVVPLAVAMIQETLAAAGPESAPGRIMGEIPNGGRPYPGLYRNHQAFVVPGGRCFSFIYPAEAQVPARLTLRDDPMLVPGGMVRRERSEPTRSTPGSSHDSLPWGSSAASRPADGGRSAVPVGFAENSERAAAAERERDREATWSYPGAKDAFRDYSGPFRPAGGEGPGPRSEWSGGAAGVPGPAAAHPDPYPRVRSDPPPAKRAAGGGAGVPGFGGRPFAGFTPASELPEARIAALRRELAAAEAAASETSSLPPSSEPSVLSPSTGPYGGVTRPPGEGPTEAPTAPRAGSGSRVHFTHKEDTFLAQFACEQQFKRKRYTTQAEMVQQIVSLCEKEGTIVPLHPEHRSAQSLRNRFNRMCAPTPPPPPSNPPPVSLICAIPLLAVGGSRSPSPWPSTSRGAATRT